MGSEDPYQLRARTEESRHRPRTISDVHVCFDGMGEIKETKTTGPVHLTIEATDQHGDIAPWFDDYWWTGLLQRWTDRMVTVYIAATPHAILHPVILYHMDMLDRVAPRWRMIALTYSGDFVNDEAVDAIAQSSYHEVRFMDGSRPITDNLDHRISRKVQLDVLFGDIRRTQTSIGATRPILTRLPSSVTAALTTAARASQTDDGQAHKNANSQPTL